MLYTRVRAEPASRIPSSWHPRSYPMESTNVARQCGTHERCGTLYNSIIHPYSSLESSEDPESSSLLGTDVDWHTESGASHFRCGSSTSIHPVAASSDQLINKVVPRLSVPRTLNPGYQHHVVQSQHSMSVHIPIMCAPYSVLCSPYNTYLAIQPVRPAAVHQRVSCDAKQAPICETSR